MSYEDRISIATPEGVDLELTLAGVGSRCAARVLDQFIQTGVLIALGLVAAAVGGFLGGGGSSSSSGGGAGTGGTAVATAVVIVLVFLVQFGYDVLFETLASGRSPGKRWTGLRVVRIDGAPVGFVTSAVRNLLRLVDFLPGFYGVAMVAVLASNRNQRLGDMAAGTLVVREKRVAATPATDARPGHRWADDVSGWDVSAITTEEVATVRRFLDRRSGLMPAARERLGTELASRLFPKVAGPTGGMGAEEFLEAVVAAKSARL